MSDGAAAVIIAALTLVGGLLAWALRLLWSTAAAVQSSKDATSANSQALRSLTTAVNALAERVSKLEGAMSRRR